METNGLSKSEIADRTAIQAIWVKYWEVTSRIVRTPAKQREALLATVAVEPNVAKVIASVNNFDKQGWDNYGIAGHRPYWGPPVDGDERAIMGDCMDFSHFGRLDVKTKVKLTVGIARENVRGTFQRTANGEWRVDGYQFIDDATC